MKDIVSTHKGKNVFLKKALMVGSAVSAAALSASSVFAQTLGTAVTDVTTAMSTDAQSWIPGIFAVVGFGILVGLGIRWLGFSKK